MPLTKKGKKIMKSMKDQYGDKKGESVFYASANKGKIKKVHGKKEGGAMERKKSKKFKEKLNPILINRPPVPKPKIPGEKSKQIKKHGMKEGGTMEPYYGSYISGTVDGKKLSNPSYRKYYGSLLKGLK